MIDRILMTSTAIAILLFIAAFCQGAQAVQSNRSHDKEHWFLASREGGCAPLSVLARKGAELTNIQNPPQLIEILRAKGHRTAVKEHDTGTSPVVEVNAPTAGLSVMFVKKEFCEKLSPGHEMKK